MNGYLRTTAHRTHSWLRGKTNFISWCVVITAASVAVGLGTLGFYSLGEGALPLSTAIYLAIQLLTMESGSLTEEKHPSFVLEVARWAGVIAALGTILSTLLAVFSNRIERFICSRLSGHCLIIGTGSTGGAVARDLLEEDIPVVVVDIDDEVLNAQEINEISYKRVGDGRDTHLLKQVAAMHASKIVIAAGNDIRNIAIAQAIDTVAALRSPTRPPLELFAHVVDNGIEELFLGQGESCRGTSWHTFNRWENSVRQLLHNYPLDGAGIPAKSTDTVNLVVVGAGVMGRTLLMRALATAHYANDILLNIAIIDANSANLQKELVRDFPEIELCGNISFIDSENHKLSVNDYLEKALGRPDSFTTVALCCENPRESASLAASLRAQWDDSRVQFFVYLGEETDCLKIDDPLSCNAKLIAFGAPGDVCTAEYIFREHLDVFAKQIHKNYVSKRLAENAEERSFPAMRPWEKLSAKYKDANRLQADHLAVKLRALGLRMERAEEASGEWPRSVSDAEIEALARAEHRRWAAGRRLAGWRYGPSRSDRSRIHPDLVPWEDLSDSTKDFDRAPVQNIPVMLKEMGFELGVISDRDASHTGI